MNGEISVENVHGSKGLDGWIQTWKLKQTL